MGRPRKFENNHAIDKVKAAVRNSRSTNYTDGYLDGARDGYRVGYDTGYADATAGKPHRETRTNTRPVKPVKSASSDN